MTAPSVVPAPIVPMELDRPVTTARDMVLLVEGLSVRFGATRVVADVSIAAHRGEVVAVLGASGSGKSSLLRALVGLVPHPGRVEAAVHRLHADGSMLDLSAADGARWREVRGRHIGVVHQDASLALTPLRRAGSLLGETRALRGVPSPRHQGELCADLRAAGFADPEPVLDRRCCDLSGGMAQRLGTALAALGDPPLLLADEPTTALDGPARSELVARLRQHADRGAAVVLVTHDVQVAAAVADTVVVLADGAVAEQGPAAQVLLAPTHGATKRLVASPGNDARAPRPHVSVGGRARALHLRGIRKAYAGPGPVLRGLDLDVGPAELLGIVGRSGAGKSTLVRIAVGLERPDAGTIEIAGLSPAASGWRRVRRHVQLVAQDPRAALNPWHRAWQLVAEPLVAHRIGTRSTRRRRAMEVLEQVGLGGDGDARPGELSTGQCQRVAIARALAVAPDLIVADEPVASLDAHLRFEALALLRDVAAQHGTAMVVVSHDLLALEAAVDRIVVLDGGIVVDDVSVEHLRTSATHSTTSELIRCFPVDPLARLRKDQR